MKEFKELELQRKSNEHIASKNNKFVESDQSKLFESLQMSHSNKRDVNRIVEFRNRNSAYAER